MYNHKYNNQIDAQCNKLLSTVMHYMRQKKKLQSGNTL